jgi:RimJ/RimL family protein N-acetyltransferase
MNGTERLLLQPQSYDAAGQVTHWDVVDRASGRCVGYVRFVGREPNDTLVIGYEIANEFRGRGFATEALRTVLAHTDGTVIAETEIDHAASRRVMEKAGMTLLHVDGERVRYAFTSDRAVRSAP